MASDLEQITSAPVKLPGLDVNELIKFRESDQGKKLASWAKNQFNQAREARTNKQHEWAMQLMMVNGDHYIKAADDPTKGKQIVQQKAPSYVRRKKINRLGAFVRNEQSKFLAAFPTIVAVPATAEEEDIRASYAAEQVWSSMVEVKKLRRTWARVIWWMVVTGTGFSKQWWDPSVEVDGPAEGQVSKGDIKFEAVSPFHLFVPDLFEREIDDQPFVIQAQTKTQEWAKAWYAEELKGVKLKEASLGGSVGQLDSQHRQIVGANDNKNDKVTVFEFWVKKGATELLPNGGLIVMVDETIVSYSEGFPYKHGQYPFSKVEHIPTDTFYGVSPVRDLMDLQREYNELRTDIAMAGKRMARPQLLATEGSIVVSKMTNQPGSVIEVRPGFALPTPLPLSQLPQYYVEQQDRVLADFDNISGQHEVSRGQAPAGVTAGTALSFLKESDDSFLTPQYQNIEEGVERVSVQSLSLFNQYVDTDRKLKVIGKDGSFDVLMLQGSDIASGLDVRVERGSSIGESQAAKQARLMEFFQNGIIDQPTVLRMLEIGGPQKLLDTMNVAARKAQRENLKLKALTVEGIAQAREPFIKSTIQQLVSDPAMLEQMGIDGMTADDVLEQVTLGAPPVVPVDDFDIHEVHMEEHNRYRMSQEYETLPPEVKQEFQKHCEMHEQFLQQAMAMQMMMGGMGAEGGVPPAGEPALEGPGADQGLMEGAVPGPQPMPDTMAADQAMA